MHLMVLTCHCKLKHLFKTKVNFSLLYVLWPRLKILVTLYTVVFCLLCVLFEFDPDSVLSLRTFSKRVLCPFACSFSYQYVPGSSLRFFANRAAISVIIAFYRGYAKFWTDNFTQGISFWGVLGSFNK